MKPPKGEKLWLTIQAKENEVFYVTSKETDRSVYFLYKEENGKLIRKGKGSTPTELEKKYVVY